MSVGISCAETRERAAIGSTIKTASKPTIMQVANRLRPPTAERIRLNKGHETIAITAATEIAVAKGQTTNTHPIAMKDPNKNRTTKSARSMNDGSFISDLMS